MAVPAETPVTQPDEEPTVATPRAEEVQRPAQQMRADVERAFARASMQSPAVQLADGTWNNYVPCDAMTPRRSFS